MVSQGCLAQVGRAKNRLGVDVFGAEVTIPRHCRILTCLDSGLGCGSANDRPAQQNFLNLPWLPKKNNDLPKKESAFFHRFKTEDPAMEELEFSGQIVKPTD